MHRTRTRFAARVNRLASGLERKGVVATYEVHDRLLANRASRRRYAQDAPLLDEVQQRVLEQLRNEGYASLQLSQLVPDAGVWQGLEADAARFVAETEAGLASEREGGESALRRRAGKEFLVRKYSWGVELGLDDPWLRLGTNPRLLDLANAYLEMWSKLEYVPRSAPGGELDRLWPWRPLGDNYPPEDEFAKELDGRSLAFTAPKGTIIFCNTSGFHRGGFATGKARSLATLTWDSPASLKALSERNYVFVPRNGGALSDAQRYALT